MGIEVRSHEPKRLLIVEDNVAYADNLVEIFTDEGYAVRAAPGRDRAAELAHQGFDVALLDVQLPDGKGSSLIPLLKAKVPDSEVILVTGNADVDSAIEAIQGGAMAYLQKPVRLEELILMVGRAAEKVELRRESRRLASELALSERKLREIMGAVSAIILEVDNQGRILFVSRGVAEILGFEPEALVGRKFAEELAEEEAVRECAALIGRVVAGDLEVIELNCRHSSGAVRRVHWRWAGTRGSPHYGVGTDVTDQREMERRIRSSEQLVMAGTLTAGLAHEIRNPLNAAILQLSLVLRMLKRVPSEFQDPLRPPLEIVGSELRRLDTLLEDFLRFARPREYRSMPVDVTQLVGHVLELERPVAKDKGIEVADAPTESSLVRGDPDAIRQILVNLLQNAVAAANTRVAVRFGRDAEGMFSIEVEDDGDGMDEKTLDRIFEPFFTTKPTGTGLGLPIVLTIARALGGDVEIESRPGHGTRACVKLPVWDGAEPTARKNEGP